jgi:hypothetical protein
MDEIETAKTNFWEKHARLGEFLAQAELNKNNGVDRPQERLEIFESSEEFVG